MLQENSWLLSPSTGGQASLGVAGGPPPINKSFFFVPLCEGEEGFSRAFALFARCVAPLQHRRQFVGPFVRLCRGLAILASQASSTRDDFGWAINATENTVSVGAGVQQVMA